VKSTKPIGNESPGTFCPVGFAAAPARDVDAVETTRLYRISLNGITATSDIYTVELAAGDDVIKYFRTGNARGGNPVRVVGRIRNLIVGNGVILPRVSRRDGDADRTVGDFVVLNFRIGSVRHPNASIHFHALDDAAAGSDRYVAVELHLAQTIDGDPSRCVRNGESGCDCRQREGNGIVPRRSIGLFDSRAVSTLQTGRFQVGVANAIAGIRVGGDPVQVDRKSRQQIARFQPLDRFFNAAVLALAMRAPLAQRNELPKHDGFPIGEDRGRQHIVVTCVPPQAWGWL
jgi:hypothetical protein